MRPKYRHRRPDDHVRRGLAQVVAELGTRQQEGVRYPRLILGLWDTFLLPSAEFSDYLGEATPQMVVRAAMATFRRMSQPVPWIRGAAEAIYVARTDAPERVAENEAELIALLERQGVRIVTPGALSVAEQIAAFRAARLVIGAHGVGMSNIVFCQSGSFVYEMLPRHYPNAAFNRLAQAAGLNYWADLFEGVGEGNPYQRGWRIDLEIVAARVEAIRQRIAATPRLELAMVFLRRTQAAHPDEAAVPIPRRSQSGAEAGAGAERKSRWQANRRRAACSHGSGAE